MLLERAADRQILAEPDLYLDEQAGTLVILDEVQQMPDLFSSLRGQVDMRRRKGFRTGQFLLLGSASNVLLHQSAESLAGRVRYIEMPPLLLEEVGKDRLNDLWLRGGFPDSFQADNDQASLAWRADFLRTYLERDIPALGPRIPATTLHRFWTMLGHAQGGQLRDQSWAQFAVRKRGLPISPNIGNLIDLSATLAPAIGLQRTLIIEADNHLNRAPKARILEAVRWEIWVSRRNRCRRVWPAALALDVAASKTHDILIPRLFDIA